MEKFRKMYIVVLTSIKRDGMENTYICVLTVLHLLLGLLACWLGIRSTCSNTASYMKLVDQPLTECKSLAANLEFRDIQLPFYLTNLAKYEAHVYEALSDLTTNQSNLLPPTVLAKIEHYLYMYKLDMQRLQPFENPNDKPWSVVDQNPILSLNMISRFADELTALGELIEKQPYISKVSDGQGKDFIKNLRSRETWPNINTLREAMAGFLSLQIVYDLEVTELSTGRILGVETGAHLSIPLMYALGQYAHTERMYTLAVPWLELTLIKLNLLSLSHLPIPSKIRMSEVQENLMAAMMEHDIDKKPYRYGPPWQYSPYSDKLIYENLTFVEQMNTMRRKDWTRVRANADHNDLNCWNICSGDNQKTEKEKPELTCWYDTTSNPALSIFPVKKELVSQNPYILQMYNVIGDSTINGIIEANKRRFARVPVVDFKSSTEPLHEDVPRLPTSAQSLKDPLLKLNRFIEVITGLSVVSKNSSKSQVVLSCALDGYVPSHLDAPIDNKVSETQGSSGKYMATMIFHLDEPHIGGGTAFLQTGIVVKPIKGSAIFWYNLKRNGEVDRQMFHCSCPVVLGHKTILTKWIVETNQFRRRPCGLSKDE